MSHISVLTTEVVREVQLQTNSVVLDATYGAGGHAAVILQHLGPTGTYIGLDVDPTAMLGAAERFKDAAATTHFLTGNFKDVAELFHKHTLPRPTAIIADLGWRLEQFTGESGEPRGFSFQADEPLLMTFGTPRAYAFTAADIVNEWKEEDIANVIYAYGEERFSRRIARAIVEARRQAPIMTARALAEIVASAVPQARGQRRTHPATKTFQALRIAVNDEFEALQVFLRDGFDLLAPGGRMAIISFHSLEDRIVKETFRTYTRDQVAHLVHKKPIAPTSEEITSNPRARSAKLRTIEKI